MSRPNKPIRGVEGRKPPHPVQTYAPQADLWKEVALVAYRELNTPVSLKCASLLEAGEYLALASMKLDPHVYNDRVAFSRDFAAVELLRKFDGLPGLTEELREASARSKAEHAEIQCLETNQRLLGAEHGEPTMSDSAWRAIQLASRKIHALLPEYDLIRHLERCRWGPGSDALNKRPYVSQYHKFKSIVTGTRGCVPFVSALMDRNHLWAGWLNGQGSYEGSFTPSMVFFRGNGFLTVPKTALVNRPICVEPGANVYLQLGLGAMFRTALKRIGIDLDSQELNRWLALLGSHTGEWATIDLSSASDTIARRLVQIIFSYSPKLVTWLKVMEAIRSPFTNWGSAKNPEWRLNHKFSSMGNGFTFELETLLFWALSSAAAEEIGGKCAAVYGDDIIVSRDAFHHVSGVLEECGFTINLAKSYNSSYFRESCGMNAWDGYEIASYRLESFDNISDTYSFHNGLVRLGLPKAAQCLLRRIPSSMRFFGPSGLGDVVLHRGGFTDWNVRIYGREDQYFFWGGVLKGLKWIPYEQRKSTYEPAILHSFASMAPAGDHPLCGDYRFGSGGVVPLTDGEWSVGEILASREVLELHGPLFGEVH